MMNRGEYIIVYVLACTWIVCLESGVPLQIIAAIDLGLGVRLRGRSYKLHIFLN